MDTTLDPMQTFEQPRRTCQRTRIAPVFSEYVYSHYNIVEWVFTVRASIVGFLLLFARQPQLDPVVFGDGINERVFGAALLCIGLLGVFVSSQIRQCWHWLNVIFGSLVFGISFLMASMYVTHGVFNHPMLYVHLVDAIASGWLAKRVMIHRFDCKHARARTHCN